MGRLVAPQGSIDVAEGQQPMESSQLSDMVQDTLLVSDPKKCL